MKTRLAHLLLLAALCGCASSGTERAEDTVDSASSLRGEFNDLIGQVDATVAALDGVVAAKSGDLDAAYSTYKSELGDLESQADRVVKKAEDLRKQSAQYIKGWEEQMADVKNPQIQEAAAKRREQAEARFAEVRSELDRIGKEYGAFHQNLSDIRTALDADLNVGGVEALEPVMAMAKTDAGPVKADLAKIMEGLEKVEKALASKASASSGG